MAKPAAFKLTIYFTSIYFQSIEVDPGTYRYFTFVNHISTTEHLVGIEYGQPISRQLQVKPKFQLGRAQPAEPINCIKLLYISL